MQKILVMCTGNSCRSQMAHGYLEKLQNGLAQVYSAGIEVHGIDHAAIAIMAEDGIDISGHTSNNIEEYLAIDFDFIITVCDHTNENCPYIPSRKAKRLHHNFIDPSKFNGSAEEKHKLYAKVRNEIKEYCQKFILRELN